MVEITERFILNTNNECFHGVIKRTYDENNNIIVHGKIKINEFYIYSVAKNENDLIINFKEIIFFIQKKLK